jgi:hypothetical protein
VANVIYPVVFQRIEKRNGVGSIIFNSDATVGLKFACKFQRYSIQLEPLEKFLGILKDLFSKRSLSRRRHASSPLNPNLSASQKAVRISVPLL